MEDLKAVKQRTHKLMLTNIKNINRGYITTDDEDMEEGYFIEYKEFNTDLKDIIDFSKSHYLIDNEEKNKIKIKYLFLS